MLVPYGMPRIRKGALFQTRGGTRYVVKKHVGSVLTVVPYRWWHGIPWSVIVGFVVGVGLGQILSRW